MTRQQRMKVVKDIMKKIRKKRKDGCRESMVGLGAVGGRLREIVAPSRRGSDRGTVPISLWDVLSRTVNCSTHWWSCATTELSWILLKVF